MIKPLLKVIPALSGNCKLVCELNSYDKKSDTDFEAVSRIGHIYPLSSKTYDKEFDVSFLNGLWEYDISKFYNSGYSDIFYKDTFKFDKNNLLVINNSHIIADRNIDYEFGCKRVSYIKSNYQFGFFAPIYCDNVNDLPDYFEIDITLSNYGMYSTKKKIKVDLTNKRKNNYLNVYLTKYFSKIDDNVIYMLPSSKQAVYHGIDVWLGGFNQYKDNIISKLFTEESTINGYDACITDGFKRNNMIIRQVMPLAFYFNINDILTDTEKIQYHNATLNISGKYIKNGQSLGFYLFDDNYTYLSLPVLQLNTNNGILEYNYTNNNLLALHDSLALKTDDVEEYLYSNKVNKTYCRWKLKYSSDEYPYITNTNINFSKNQNLYNLYYEYPQNYYWTSVFCNLDNNEINVLLPLGDNIDNYYNENQYLTQKYMLSLNNYINNWFDMTDSLSLSDILINTNWCDVHSDGKVFYHGLLYDFNKIYLEHNITNKIDKFAILFYIDDTNFYSKDKISDYIYAKYSLEYKSQNNVMVNLYSFNGDSSQIYVNSLYNLEDNSDKQYNMLSNTNQYYSYNAQGIGKFVELEDLGIDFYEVNNFYSINDIKNIIPVNKFNYINDNMITGYELLPINYLSNITVNNNILINKSDNSYFFSYNSTNIKNPLSTLETNLTYIDETINSYTFYRKHNFVSYSVISNILNGSKIKGLLKNINQYNFYPKYQLPNNKDIYNIFIKEDKHNKFYGNITYYSHIENDADVIYIDPFNLKDRLNNYYQLKGNIYIDDITNDYIKLSDIVGTNNIYIYTNNDTDVILDLLDYTNTYYKQEKFGFNKYNVTKFITEINALYSSTVNNNIICYTYNFNYNDTVISNKIITSYNIYNNSSYVFGYFYVSNIDTNTYTIYLNNYNNDEVVLQCANINELYNYAYLANAMIKVNNSYIVQQNCIGTYMYRDSYIFRHPQKLIKSINYLSYVYDNNYVVSNDYDFNIISYFTPEDKKIELDILSYIKDYDDTEKTTYYSYLYNIYSLPNYSNYSKYIYNEDITLNTTTLTNIMYLYDDYNYSEMYGKFLNIQHISTFDLYIKEYALNKSNKEIDLSKKTNINDYIYIKYTLIDNFKQIFIPLSDIFGNTSVLKYIRTVDNLLFDIITPQVQLTNIELYFKKKFIKLTKPIYDNILSLNTSHYNDLYLYRLEQDTDSKKDVKFIEGTYYQSYYTNYSSSYTIVPLFDNVLRQYMDNTVIYKSYLLNSIYPVNYIDENRDIKYTLYRTDSNDRLCLVDVSHIEDFTYPGTYLFNPTSNKPSFIYDKFVITEENVDKNILNGEKIITYSYVSSKIPTYDKLETLTTEYINIVDNKEIPFNSNEVTNGYKINTYTYNGITYGFYLNKISLKNINSIFNLSFTDYTNIRYFTKVNGISIIDNHEYLTNMFKLFIPFIKYNILTLLYDIPLFMTPYKTVFNKKYTNQIQKNGKNHIIFDKNRIDTITLYRYYDAIVPYIKESNNIYTEYMLKTKNTAVFPITSVMYNDNINIYNYNGIRLYSNDTTYTNIKQLEYKYYNDNKLINLDTEFDIFISNNLLEIDLIKYQEDDMVIKYFENYLNNQKMDKFNKDEILFLYNKYKVLISVTPERLDDTYTNKIYSLTYKFSLK